MAPSQSRPIQLSALETLPHELTVSIAGHLDIEDLRNLSTTSWTIRAHIKPVHRERAQIRHFKDLSIQTDFAFLQSGLLSHWLDQILTHPFMRKHVKSVQITCDPFEGFIVMPPGQFFSKYWGQKLQYATIESLVTLSNAVKQNTMSPVEKKWFSTIYPRPMLLILLSMLPNVTELCLSEFGADTSRWMKVVINSLRTHKMRTPNEMTADGRILVSNPPKISFPPITTLVIQPELEFLLLSEVVPLLLIPSLRHCRLNDVKEVADDLATHPTKPLWTLRESLACKVTTLELAKPRIIPTHLISLIQGMPNLVSCKLEYPYGGLIQQSLPNGHTIFIRNAHEMCMCFIDHLAELLTRPQQTVTVTCDQSTVTIAYCRKPM